MLLGKLQLGLSKFSTNTWIQILKRALEVKSRWQTTWSSHAKTGISKFPQSLLGLIQEEPLLVLSQWQEHLQLHFLAFVHLFLGALSSVGAEIKGEMGVHWAASLPRLSQYLGLPRAPPESAWGHSCRSAKMCCLLCRAASWNLMAQIYYLFYIL